MFGPTPHTPTFPPRSELEWCCWWVYILFDINHEFCMIWSPESVYLQFSALGPRDGSHSDSWGRRTLIILYHCVSLCETRECGGGVRWHKELTESCVSFCLGISLPVVFLKQRVGPLSTWRVKLLKSLVLGLESEISFLAGYLRSGWASAIAEIQINVALGTGLKMGSGTGQRGASVVSPFGS